MQLTVARSDDYINKDIVVDYNYDQICSVVGQVARLHTNNYPLWNFIADDYLCKIYFNEIVKSYMFHGPKEVFDKLCPSPLQKKKFIVFGTNMAGKYDFFVFKILCDISKGAEYQNFLVERLAVKSGLDKDGLTILSEDDEGYDPDLFYYSPWVKS